jgi:hypothetical protein
LNPKFLLVKSPCWSGHHVCFEIAIFGWFFFVTTAATPYLDGSPHEAMACYWSPSLEKGAAGRVDPLVVPLGYPLGLLLLVRYYLKQHN